MSWRSPCRPTASARSWTRCTISTRHEASRHVSAVVAAKMTPEFLRWYFKSSTIAASFVAEFGGACLPGRALSPRTTDHGDDATLIETVSL